MIVTIDGPAGAGKSSASRELARRLGFRFLDTGAMYRCVALAAIRRSLGWDDASALAELAESLQIEVGDDRVWLDGEDVTSTIRTMEITTATRYAADNPGVRAHLVVLQRLAANDQNVVTEGRDQGTVVFPTAACKIFLTATAEERARRRMADLHARGERFDYDEVLSRQQDRDRRDCTRSVGPLVQADDAIELVTDGLTAEQVVDRLELIVRQRMNDIHS